MTGVSQSKINRRLLEATRLGLFSGVIDMLERGADIEARDEGTGNFTPLIVAAFSGNLGLVEFLVKKGAHIEAQSNEGDTALIWAAFMGKKDIVDYLLEQGARINHQNNLGKSALHHAVNEWQPAVVVSLLKAGADMDLQDCRNETPQGIISDRGKREDIAELFAKKRKEIFDRQVEEGLAVISNGLPYDLPIKHALPVRRRKL